MSKDKPMKWVRSPSFRKYFATSFGVSKSGDIFRLDFGDEATKFSDKPEDFAYVSEAQIIMPKEAVKALYYMLKKMDKEEAFK